MFRPLLLTFAILGSLIPSCHTVPTPPPPVDVRSAPQLSAADLEFKGRIEAQSLAADYAANLLSDGNPKLAVQGSIGVIKTLVAGNATQKQKDEAMAPVLSALKGEIATANAGWSKANSEADALRQQMADLKTRVEKERIEAAAELKRQLEAARDDERRKAEAQTRSIISWLFFGFGLVCEAAAAVIFFYASAIPQLGPKAALAAGVAGVVSIGTGVAVLQLLAHPNVVWWGIGVILALLAASAALIYSNHQHHVTLTPST